jgi:putative hemolysin
MLLIEVLVIVLLTVINGLFAMSELAVVSSRKTRLSHMTEMGVRGARSTLRLIDDPSRFLSTVQIGISLVAILAGAFGGATVANRLGHWFDSFPAVAPNGATVAVGIVVAAITYLSIVIGELVPKRIALSNPERVASFVAGPMTAVSQLAAPLVWVLKASTDSILRILKLSRVPEATITEDEVKSLIAEGTRAGIFVPREREMIEGVLRLADRPVRVIMTPRSEIVWVDVDADLDDLVRTAADSRVSRLLVCEGAIDRAVGVLHMKDLLPVALKGKPLNLRSLVSPVLKVPDRTSVLKLLDLFRREGIHMAVAVDELGALEGLVTLTDVLESIAGEFPERGEAFEPPIVAREDGTWLVDGTLPLDELEDRIQLRGLREDTAFYTVAGLVLQQLGHIPKVGESFVHRGARFEVVDMDGRRIDKVLVSRIRTEEPMETIM